MTEKSPIRFAFFGTPELAVTILEHLEKSGRIPELIVTAPDKKQGRGLQLHCPAVKKYADAHSIPALQPQKITEDIIAELKKSEWDVFIVAAYGKILPKALLEIPRRGVLNVHPSLLPKLRGPSPIVSAILHDEKETGVSVMLLDEEMDHGPIVAQKKLHIDEWPPYASQLEKTLSDEGGKLLCDVLEPWVFGEIDATEQKHDEATFCVKIKKEDGLINLSDDPYANLLKIRGLENGSGAFTFFERNEKKIRVRITRASLHKNELKIERVIPEGKSEMNFEDFARSGAAPSTT